VQTKNEKNLLLAFIILFLLISFFRTSIRIRYIVPVLPALIILSTAGLHKLAGLTKDIYTPVFRRCGTVLLPATMLALFGINALYLVNQFRVVDPISYLSGRVKREDYISRFRPEYPVMKFANLHLTDNDKIMGLYLGNRRYYCDRDIVFGEGLITRSVILSSSAGELFKDIKNDGFTHVIVHLDLLKDWLGTLNERERALFVEFFNRYLHILDKNLPYVLFEMRHPQDRNPT
jgi:hypothetical protein